MTNIQDFNQFLALQKSQIPVLGFMLNLALAAFYAFLIGRVYVYYGQSLSNRRQFAKNFVLLTVTITLIITIVKSSLALSLGLVGALSIVRFRSAIKEPEELMYLFFCIAIGLGLGADQIVITSLAFVFIAALLIAKKYSRATPKEQALFLTINNLKASIDPNQVVSLLDKHMKMVELKKMDKRQDGLFFSFYVYIHDFATLTQCSEALSQLDPKVSVTFTDFKGHM